MRYCTCDVFVCREMADKENVPLSKKRKLSLSLKNRFKNVSDSELKELSKAKMPKNATLSSRWAMKKFIDWFCEYNIRNPDSKCPEEVLLPSC